VISSTHKIIFVLLVEVVSELCEFIRIVRNRKPQSLSAHAVPWSLKIPVCKTKNAALKPGIRLVKWTPRPQPEQESIFRIFLLGGLDFDIYLDRLLRATTKKRSSTLLATKSAPQTKSWLSLWCHYKVRPCQLLLSALAQSKLKTSEYYYYFLSSVAYLMIPRDFKNY